MRKGKTGLSILATLILTAVLSMPCLAQDSGEDLPEVMKSGDIAYMSGGVGLDERNAMQTVVKDYNLVVSNANKKNKFTAGITIVIKGKGGKEIFMAQDTGPLLYVKLPVGAYTVEAMNGDQQMKRRITVTAHKSTHVHLVWTSSHDQCAGKPAKAVKKKADRAEPKGAVKHMRKDTAKKAPHKTEKEKAWGNESAPAMKKEEAKKEDVKKEEVKKEESTEEAKKEETKKEEVTEEAKKEEAKKEKARKKEEAKKEKARKKEEAKKEEMKKEESKKDEDKKDEAKKEDVKKEEAKKEEEKKDAPKGDEDKKEKEESSKDKSKKDDARDLTKPVTKDM